MCGLKEKLNYSNDLRYTVLVNFHYPVICETDHATAETVTVPGFPELV